MDRTENMLNRAILVAVGLSYDLDIMDSVDKSRISHLNYVLRKAGIHKDDVNYEYLLEKAWLYS